jgi:hypothetical protein
MKRYNNEPFELKAKFDGKCAETGKIIKRGEYCIYYPSGKKNYHVDSKQAETFRNMKMDDALGYSF